LALTAAPAQAWFAGRHATDLVEVSNDLAALDAGGWWAVVVTFEGVVTLARFAHVAQAPPPSHPWPGVDIVSWRSSTSGEQYRHDVEGVRDLIAAGTVYQVNLCRRLSAPMPVGCDHLLGLATVLHREHPSPFGGSVHLPDHGVHVASASPELFVRRDGARVWSSPIKGTATVADELLPKDEAENVMIVDLVRNDLGRVCRTGSIEVDALLRVESHPGLVHLVSTVSGTLRDDAGWPELMAAAFPPGSVSGAPKSSALRSISALEPVPRGPYCGAVGWVDADRRRAELAVGIRTFFVDVDEAGSRLCFGTGAGITWGSDPAREWDETELKASRLLAVAAGATDGSGT
jgi:para-aminobenzoate synthetase component 1